MGLSSIATSVGRTKKVNTDIADIITFIESDWGLQMRLFPVQKVILKAHYGLALEDKVPTINLSDWRRESFRKMTEAEYLQYLYDEGRCNIAKVEPGKQRREMILSIGRRSGKCILGKSLVLTNKGIFPIERLSNSEEEYSPLQLTIAQEGKSQRAETQFFYNGGFKAVNKITTQNGFSLGGTDNHRIKVLDQNGRIVWRYMSDLQIGDVVCIHRNTDLWSDTYYSTSGYSNEIGRKAFNVPDSIDEDWGLLLGLLVGDGNWTNRSSVAFTADDQDVKECVIELYQRFFGDWSFTPDKRTKNTGCLRSHNKKARQFLHDIGWSYHCGRYDKVIPKCILQSPKSVVCSFMKGLFETDGSVSKKGNEISFSTASYDLAYQVQLLLLNMGIVSKLTTKFNKKMQRNYYGVCLIGLRSRQIFKEEIGFISDRKQARLEKGLLEKTREGGQLNSIPNLRDTMKELLLSTKKMGANKGWNRTTLRALLGNTIKPSSKEQVTYERIQKVLNSDLDMDQNILGHLQELLDLDYFFDPIVSIEQDTAKVYDLNVPNGSMFVANGMTNHNTTISACIAAYETYKLISKGDPQGYYGLPHSNNIQIISVATDKDQAGLLYQEVSGHYRNCSFFSPYTANNTQSYARFQTPKDIERTGSYIDDPTAKATLKITFRSCVAKGLRGAGNIVVILDEVAHFTDKGQSGAEAVYNAVTPSTSAFSQKDPNDSRVPIGPVEGRIISISSPLGRQGQFYKLFSIAMQGGRASENMLAIQAPTWEVNPTVPASEFEKHYIKDTTVFFTEYGGEFTDRTRGWLEDPRDLMECVDPKLKPRTQGRARQPHFLGLDLGLVGDGTAVAIGHIESRDGENKIVLDYIDQIKAGEGEYAHLDRLEFDDVAEWVNNLARRFYITEGLFDQWAGIPFEQALQKKGLKQLKSEHFTKNKTSEIYKNFKDMMWDKKLVLFDYPIPDGQEHCDYITELTELQATKHSKYIVTVEAPNMKGKHDDRSDALVRMVWLASQNLGNSAYISKGGRGAPLSTRGAYISQSAKLRRTGSHSSRQAPKGRKR